MHSQKHLERFRLYQARRLNWAMRGKIHGRVREEENREGRVGVGERSLEVKIFVIDYGSRQFRKTATVFYCRAGVEIHMIGSETQGKVKVNI